MRRTVLVILALTAAGCSEKKKPQPSLAEALPTLLVPPEATLISREGGEDALQIRFHSDLEPAPVADYYRAALSRAPWNLVSDIPTQDGAVALYAERAKGPPLWVTIRKVQGTTGSIVDLAGAKVSGGK